jgi:hypothetical protein
MTNYNYINVKRGRKEDHGNGINYENHLLLG